MHILLIQPYAAIRLHKIARALHGSGVKVSLAYTHARPSQLYQGLEEDIYQEQIHLPDLRSLWDIAPQYDLIHSFNEPDDMTVLAMAAKTPVIHDTADLMSLRDGQARQFVEGVANRGATACTYSTVYQRDKAIELYGVNTPTLIFGNYVSRRDLPTERLPKLSKEDGCLHLAYQGSIGGTRHRDYKDLFGDLAFQGVHVHVYPAHYDADIAAQYKGARYIHYNKPIAPHLLLTQLTQYDGGLIPFNLEKGNKEFLDTTIANKLYEYWGAGLPAITSDIQSYRHVFKNGGCGFVFGSAKDIVDRKEWIQSAHVNPTSVRTVEGEISFLTEFYRQILLFDHIHLKEKIDFWQAEYAMQTAREMWRK